MKFIAMAVFCLIPLMSTVVYGEESTGAPVAASSTGGTEITTPAAEEATQGLFERVRGAYVRAARQGKLLAATQGSATPAPVKQ